MDMVVVLIKKFDEKFLHPWKKGQSKWMPSKIILNMQVVLWIQQICFPTKFM